MAGKLGTKVTVEAGLNNWQKHILELALLVLVSDAVPFALTGFAFLPFLLLALITQKFLVILVIGGVFCLLVFLAARAQCFMGFARVCIKIDNGENPGMGACFKEFISRFDMLLPAALLGLIDNILFFFLFMLPMLLTGLAMAGLYLPHETGFPEQFERILDVVRNPFTSLFIGTAAMGLVCVYFYVMLRMFFCYYLLALGFNGVVSSIKESFRLTKGRLWELSVFFTGAGLIMLLGSVGSIITYVLAAPIYQLSVVRACRTLQGFLSDAKKQP